MAHLGQCTRQAPGHLSCSDLERAQNARPTKSVPLQSTREPEPEQLTPGKCTKCRAHFGQHPCRATWSLRSVDSESTRHPELSSTLSAQQRLSKHAGSVRYSFFPNVKFYFWKSILEKSNPKQQKCCAHKEVHDGIIYEFQLRRPQSSLIKKVTWAVCGKEGGGSRKKS